MDQSEIVVLSWLLGIIALVAFGALVTMGKEFLSSAGWKKHHLYGKEIPDVVFQGLDGREIRLRDYRGSNIIIGMVYETINSQALRNINEGWPFGGWPFGKVFADYHDRVTIFQVWIGDPNKLKSRLKDIGVTAAFVFDENEFMRKNFERGTGVPLVVDSQGVVRCVPHVPFTHRGLEKLLRSIVSER